MMETEVGIVFKRSNGQLLCFIGSYAEADSEGLHVCSFDPKSGMLERLHSVSGLHNPTFLAIDEHHSRLYAIEEASGSQGERLGAVSVFNIDQGHGSLQLIHSASTIPAPTCHIELDQTNQCVIVSSYHGGMVGVTQIGTDGHLSEETHIQQHEGKSVLPVQDRPRAHSANIDHNNRFVIVCDLGLDRLFTYRLDAETGKLSYASDVRVAPGAGPRHFTFHPTLPRGYVINELDSTVTVFDYDDQTGKLDALQTISTLPESYTGDNACADIHISPDGKFLYGSNRGHDSIVVYSINDSGHLTLVDHTSTQGGHPRNFALSPDGAYLLAANRDGNNIVVFSRNEQTGKLTPTGHQLELSKPVCVKF